MTSKRKESRSGGEPPRTRRRFTQEFKLEAVRLASSGARRPAEVARELGIRADMLRQWRRQAEARAARPLTDVFPGPGGGRGERLQMSAPNLAFSTLGRDVMAAVSTCLARNVSGAPARF